MTTEQFLTDFPETEHNENCLANIACPKCGYRGKFRIQATIIAEVYDEGTERDASDIEWEDDAFCQCGDCAFEGKVKDFTFNGLDE